MNPCTETIIGKIKRALDKNDDIAAAYIFGSILDRSVFNDIDVLVLPQNGVANPFLDTEITCKLEDTLDNLYIIDLLFFDLSCADPIVLGKAVEKGRLITKRNETLLSAKLEELSDFFLSNEPVIFQRKLYLEEVFK